MGINSILLFQRMFKKSSFVNRPRRRHCFPRSPNQRTTSCQRCCSYEKILRFESFQKWKMWFQIRQNQVSCSRWNWCGVSKLHRSTDQKVYHTHKCAKVVKKVTKKIVKKGKKGKVVKKRVTKKVVKKLVLKKKSAKKSAKKVTAKKSAKKVTAKRSAKKVTAKKSV